MIFYIACFWIGWAYGMGSLLMMDSAGLLEF
jgi:hypothetical protein